jgi:hypothetical protein
MGAIELGSARVVFADDAVRVGEPMGGEKLTRTRVATRDLHDGKVLGLPSIHGD